MKHARWRTPFQNPCTAAAGMGRQLQAGGYPQTQRLRLCVVRTHAHPGPPFGARQWQTVAEAGARWRPRSVPRRSPSSLPTPSCRSGGRQWHSNGRRICRHWPAHSATSSRCERTRPLTCCCPAPNVLEMSAAAGGDGTAAAAGVVRVFAPRAPHAACTRAHLASWWACAPWQPARRAEQDHGTTVALATAAACHGTLAAACATACNSLQLPGNASLKDHDPELYDLIEKERVRQLSGLELIASEVRTCYVRVWRGRFPPRQQPHTNTTARTHPLGRCRTSRPAPSWSAWAPC